MGVVVAFGMILEPAALAVPHGDAQRPLLPTPQVARGGTGCQGADRWGSNERGDDLRLDEGLDTGPVLTAQAIDIGAEENAGELT